MSRAATIIIPVYADWSSLKDCLEAVMATVDLTKNKVILVNDCGPEAEQLEANIQKFIKGHAGFEYYRNPRNLGFVKTCNRAVLELDKSGNDILLLNSDTKPTNGWLDEMLDLLSTSAKNGTVTPRTNNATLATIPLWAAAQKGLGPAQSFAFFQKLKSLLPRSYQIPTAHGYCMLVRRSLITKYGFFDEIFGKGYGEENDFSQRLIKHGYRNLLANHAFVFHLEARSFTAQRKAKLVEQNLKIVWQRYPNYRQDVRDFMAKTTAAERQLETKAGLKSPKLTFAKKFWRRLKN